MRLFGKRARNNTDDVWTLAQGEIDGHATILRSKRTRRDRARPVRVTVKIGLSKPDARGLPTPEEMDFLEDVEETLFSELEQHGAEMVLVVTANKAREFIAYCSSPDWLETWGPSVISRWGERRPGTGVETAAEPGWETYKAFAVR